jgi:hypothetical protein
MRRLSVAKEGEQAIQCSIVIGKIMMLRCSASDTETTAAEPDSVYGAGQQQALGFGLEQREL